MGKGRSTTDGSTPEIKSSKTRRYHGSGLWFRSPVGENRSWLTDLQHPGGFHDRRLALPFGKFRRLLTVCVNAGESFSVLVKHGHLPVLVLAALVFPQLGVLAGGLRGLDLSHDNQYLNPRLRAQVLTRVLRPKESIYCSLSELIRFQLPSYREVLQAGSRTGKQRQPPRSCFAIGVMCHQISNDTHRKFGVAREASTASNL